MGQLSAVFSIAAIPLLVTACDEARPVWLVISFALGAAIMLLGCGLFVLRPLEQLARTTQGWRIGSTLNAASLRSLPTEIAVLAEAFTRATDALNRREAELVAASAQQDLLMQEIHHRVKNNLQIVASLLNLQASRIRVPEARAEFQSARDRISALATLHRHLYAHGELQTINLRSFIIELCGQLFQALGETEGERISLAVDAPEMQMVSDQAVPLALIVTEAVTNAVKYAFPSGRRGHIAVQLTEADGRAEMTIEDDGVGIPAGRVETETGTRDGIGLQLIRGFARQLGATLIVEEGQGTRYRVSVPLLLGRVASPALAGGLTYR